MSYYADVEPDDRRALVVGALSVLVSIVLIVASCSRGALVNPADSIRAASALGFSEATVVRSTWLFPVFSGCDGGDALAVTLDATNPVGQQTQVIACSGWPFKGWTVRVK